jgi:hypothetical protein
MNCSNGYWKNGSNCQTCGLCKNGLCNHENGICKNEMCINEKLEKPFCNKCRDSLGRSPNCSSSSIELKKTPRNYSSSSKIITSWLVALSLIVLIKFLLNSIYSENKANDFLYDLEFENIINTKYNLTSVSGRF